jgi:hypothetical protein
VALTRHRVETTIFVARNTAKDLSTLAKQIGRPDERRAATQFHCLDNIAPVPPMTAPEILARLSDPGFERRQRQTGEGGEEGDPAAAAARQRFHRQDNPPATGKDPGREPGADTEVSAPPDERQAERHGTIRSAMRKARQILRRLQPRKAAHGADDAAADAAILTENADEADEQVNEAAEVVESIEAEAPEASPDAAESEAAKQPAKPEMDAYLAALLAEAEILREREEVERPAVVRQRRAGRGRTM